MAYIGTSPSNGVRRVHTYTATANQTTFTGSSTEGVTLTYADTNYIDVFQNGVLLGSADYTSTSGTSVVLAQGASVSDLVVIVVYDVFSVADTVSKTSGGSFDSGITISGDLTIPDKIIHDGDTNTAIRFPSADTVTFETGGSEAVRIDSSQNLLVSGTSTAPHTLSSGGGFIVRNLSALLSVARAGDECAIFNRTDSDGNIVSFRKGGTTVGNLGAEGGDSLYIQGGTTSGCGLHFHPSTAQVAPLRNGARIDNVIDIGGSSHRFDDVRATNGTIQTSDRNDKQDIEELTDAETRVAVVAKGLMRKFRWKDKVVEKGDNARTHFGIIAQDLQDAFTAEGLDAGDYAMFISDTWWQKEITVDAVVADEANGIEAQDAYTYMDIKEEATDGYTEKTRLGVRYSELLAFIISAI